MSVFAVDLSNWSGELSPVHIACLQQNSVRYAVVRASLEPGRNRQQIARQQLDALIAAGIEVGVYLWCYGSWQAEQTVIDTVALLDGRPCRWFFLDVEDEGDPVDAAWLRRAVNEIVRQGRQPAVYSGAWYWNDPRYLNGSTALSDVPLWTADYDGVPDLAQVHLYGGWPASLVYGKQYAGSGQQSFCDLFVDLNVFDERVLTPAPKPAPTPAPAVTIEQVQLGLIDKIVHGDWTTAHTDLGRILEAHA